jgi:hypothetical protein
MNTRLLWDVAWIGLAACAVIAPDGRAQCPAWSGGFGLNGLNNDAVAMAVFDDGSGSALYVGGNFTSAGGNEADRIAKWNGSSWSSVGGGLGTVNGGSVSALAVFDDGSGPALYAGGSFSSAGGTSVNNIARWNGSSWAALGGGVGGGGSPPVRALAVLDDGTGPALYVGGQFSVVGGVNASNVAKWNGSSWSVLANGLSFGAVSALTVFDDGNGPALYAGGSFATSGGTPVNHIAKWNGTRWSALGSGLGSTQSDSVAALTVYDDGTGPALYAAGSFQFAGALLVNGVAKWNGSSWSSLGTGLGNGGAFALGVFDDGTGPALFLGGIFDVVDGINAHSIAEWNGSIWSALGGGISGGGVDLSVKTLAVFDDGSGLVLHVGGGLLQAGGINVNHIAKWNGTIWSPCNGGGNGMDSYVSALTAFDDGSGSAIFAGGGFTLAGGVNVARIAKWNGATWSPLGSGVNGPVFALTGFDDGSGPALYAGGNFTQAGGTGAFNVARWNGSSWSSLGHGIGNTGGAVYALSVFDDGSGAKLYAGGLFNAGSGLTNIAKWDGSSWQSLAGGMNDTVFALITFDDGSGPGLYAAGWFSNAGGVSANHVAKWNGASWFALGPGLFGGPNPSVSALAIFDDGSGPALYAGGAFDSTAGTYVQHIAKWNGTTWMPVGNGVGYAAVYSLATFDDGSGPALYAGGFFSAVGGAAHNIARWNGSAWSALGGGMDSPVLALATFEQSTGPALFAGGDFTTAGSIPSYRIGVWPRCDHPGQHLCFGDGSGAPCPCMNTGSPGHGCQNSAMTGGARMDSSGDASLAHDTLVLTISGEMPSVFGIVFQGDVQVSPTDFGDGLRCAGGLPERLYVKNSGSGTFSVPQSGDLSLSARSAALGDVIHPGQVRTYQAYYRDADLSFCAPPLGGSWNVSSAMRIGWTQ